MLAEDWLREYDLLRKIQIEIDITRALQHIYAVYQPCRSGPGLNLEKLISTGDSLFSA